MQLSGPLSVLPAPGRSVNALFRRQKPYCRQTFAGVSPVSKPAFLPPLSTFYRNELAWLREAGRRFAHDHPKMARRLDWHGEDSRDPHVERLLESFAFLAARIQRQNDDLFPSVARMLLGTLAPSLIQPLPPVSVVHVPADPAKDAWASFWTVPAHTLMHAQTREGPVCTFRTAWPLDLWPVVVEGTERVSREQYPRLSGRMDTRWLLRVRLRSEGLPFSLCPLPRIRLYAGGQEHDAALLVRALQADKPRIAWSAGGVTCEQGGSVEPSGWSEEHDILPRPAPCHPGFHVLREVLYAPFRFMFFDVPAAGICSFPGHNVDLLLTLPDDDPVHDSPLFRAHGPQGGFTLQTGCVPVVNLFPRTTSPVRITHQTGTFRLCPDQTREATTEIHSLQEVFRISGQEGQPVRIPPFFSDDARNRAEPSSLFWTSEHVPSNSHEGTDVHIHFADALLDPLQPVGDVVFARVLCTNRSLASHLPVGGILSSERPLPAGDVVCLKRPGLTVPPPGDGTLLWALIRQMAANPVAPTDDGVLTRLTRDLVALYGHVTGCPEAGSLVEAVVQVSSVPRVHPLRQEAWRGFVEGQHITLTLDDRQNPVAFLLGQALALFWTSHSDHRSPVTCTLQGTSRERPWVAWARAPQAA